MKVFEIAENYVLNCPICNEGFCALHQVAVETYFRHEDTEDTGLRISCGDTGRQSVSSTVIGNPSHRRSGLRILFWCEHCSQGEPKTPLLSLNIAQHKGTTQIGWSQIDNPEDIEMIP